MELNYLATQLNGDDRDKQILRNFSIRQMRRNEEKGNKKKKKKKKAN